MRDGDSPVCRRGVCLEASANPSNCWVKSISKLVVLPSFVGDFCLRGVGDGDLDDDVRLRDLLGVVWSIPRGF